MVVRFNQTGDFFGSAFPPIKRNNPTLLKTTNPMQLTINGETRQFAASLTIAELLEMVGLQGKPVAVERNLEVVSYTKYDEVTLVDGDRLEIVTLVGGG